MEAKELRIGNKVLFKDKIVEVAGISGIVYSFGAIDITILIDKKLEIHDLKRIKPIELTKDFFRKNRNATGWSDATEMIDIGFLDGVVCECEDNKEAIYVDICSYGHLEEVKHTRYLHELQNLYFILTKQELELKL